jgi:hypothetical protein
VLRKPTPKPWSSSLVVAPSTRPEGLRTTQDWNVFNYCATKYMKVVTCADAPSKYRDLSFVFAVGFDKPWVIHAALAPAALHASFSSLIPKEDAVLYTQSALRGLRQSLLPSRPATLRRDPCLTTSLFLGVFEESAPPPDVSFPFADIVQDFYGSSQSNGLVHFQAIAQILEAQFEHSERLDINSLSILQLTLLDTTLYHLATRSILEPDVDAIWDAFPIKAIAKYVELLELQASDSSSPPLILPVLGRTPPALFVLILRLTWLSRRLPLRHDEDYQHLLQCMTELDRIKQEFPVVNFNDVTSPKLDETPPPSSSEVSAKLYYLAVQIFTAKVIDPEHLTAGSPQIQDWLNKGATLLEMYDTTTPCAQFICWPLLVLGCAATSIQTSAAAESDSSDNLARSRCIRELIRVILLQIWDVSYSGHVQRTLAALEKVWKQPDIFASFSRSRSLVSFDSEYDGLNAIVYKDGLGATFLPEDGG